MYIQTKTISSDLISLTADVGTVCFNFLHFVENLRSSIYQRDQRAVDASYDGQILAIRPY